MSLQNQLTNSFWCIPCQNRRPLEGLCWSRKRIDDLKQDKYLLWDFSKVHTAPQEDSVFILFRTDSDVRGIVGYGQIKNVNWENKTVELHFIKHLKVIKHRPLYWDIDWYRECSAIIPNDCPILIDDRTIVDAVKEKIPIFKENKKFSHLSFDFQDIKTEEILEKGKQRIGQQQLRQSLVNYLGGCEVTGIDNQALLIASHIKPWAKFPKDRGRLANCLLLCSSLDSLFDKGLISFDEHGNILISSLLDSKVRIQYGLSKQLRLNLKKRESIDNSLKEETILNLKYHRKNIFIK